ncbi:LAME_0H07030g1_1 [Lachancea meyersii CBS 8951]|uniref:Peptide-N(4)-(N-acetyl-beta-glucosaminyl)asparagine amidase n=1 Tax=Lachancea meyersii CBS 8951 TaxID=1266667 RepID=A0A1G4KEP5_9SACH|nr:LAME_0H07030g1_1 [Lachancea meyersii CBS 8951]
MDDKEMFSQLASRFMALYRDKIIHKFKNESDPHRFQRLLQTNEFARTLYGLSQSLCNRYEVDHWQAQVLDTADLEIIYANVDAVEGSEGDYVDRLVKELLRYFKNDFFKWCNSPDCEHCGCSGEQMTAIGNEGANSDERRFDCGVVEVYRCPNCSKTTRFPRYNDPMKLLETRKGRCGEWCNLFMLFLKSFGIESRYVWNREDHVWCEFYSSNLKRWVHVDSCEQSFDEPHIYSVNWNKKMSYAIAFGCTIATDVSRKYILQNELSRTEIAEEDLKFLLDTITRRLRLNLSDEEIYKLACRDEQEMLMLYGSVDGASIVTKSTSAMKGRESGSTAWKKGRGENGKS